MGYDANVFDLDITISKNKAVEYYAENGEDPTLYFGLENFCLGWEKRKDGFHELKYVSEIRYDDIETLADALIEIGAVGSFSAVGEDGRPSSLVKYDLSEKELVKSYGHIEWVYDMSWEYDMEM